MRHRCRSANELRSTPYLHFARQLLAPESRLSRSRSQKQLFYWSYPLLFLKCLELLKSSSPDSRTATEYSFMDSVGRQRSETDLNYIFCSAALLSLHRMLPDVCATFIFVQPANWAKTALAKIQNPASHQHDRNTDRYSSVLPSLDSCDAYRETTL